MGTVACSQEKERGPWGSKITAMAAAVHDLSIEVESVDYRGIDDPAGRVAKLLDTAVRLKGPLVLLGSSMGGHVSASAAARTQTRGLSLLAPAFYMQAFEAHTPHAASCPPV